MTLWKIRVSIKCNVLQPLYRKTLGEPKRSAHDNYSGVFAAGNEGVVSLFLTTEHKFLRQK